MTDSIYTAMFSILLVFILLTIEQFMGFEVTVIIILAVITAHQSDMERRLKE